MLNSRSKLPIFLEDGLKKAKDVIRRTISTSEYIASRKDLNNRNILQCPELYLLKLNMKDYRDFLLTFDIPERRLILLKYEVTGFRQQELYDNYGIHSDLIRSFIGLKKPIPRDKRKPKFLKIKSSDEYSKEFFAFLALLCRVPVDWFEVFEPKIEWKAEYMNFLPNVYMSREQFISYLSLLDKKYHDVRGIILTLEANVVLYLRVENWKGSFLVEMFNPFCPAKEYLALLEVLLPFKPIEGHMPTVVDTQYNYAFICTETIGVPVCIPIEFIPRHTYESSSK